MKKILLIILTSISVFSCKSQNHSGSVWTEKYESKIYQQIYDEMKHRLPDEARRSQLAAYAVKRLKSELPNGLESVSADSVHRLSVKIGKEYGYAHATGQHDDGLTPTAVPWTAELEQTLREAFLKGMAPEDLKKGNQLCDCILTKLKKIYPDSVVIPFPQDVVLKVAKDCHD